MITENKIVYQDNEVIKFLIESPKYGNFIEAAKKYNELAIKYHGEFACLNILPKVA